MQAVKRRVQKTAGPKPRKRAVKSTAANKSTKIWRCSTGEKVNRLRATHTASVAPAYCTSAACRCREIQFFRLGLILDIFLKAANPSRQKCPGRRPPVWFAERAGKNAFDVLRKTVAAARARGNCVTVGSGSAGTLAVQS